MAEAVDHPAHYKSGGIEAIDVIEAFGLGFCLEGEEGRDRRGGGGVRVSRHIHLCLDIRGAIQGTGWKALSSPDGRRVSKAEAIGYLMDRLAEGKRVLPMDKDCVGFDYQTGCPGHEDEAEAPDTEVTHG
ncbi:MAG TPA: DUF3310 domain-containing protein [Polyangia bacterium]|nr:DUF3310 domain-containing protein [Polyangia bacterium]